MYESRRLEVLLDYVTRSSSGSLHAQQVFTETSAAAQTADTRTGIRLLPEATEYRTFQQVTAAPLLFLNQLT